jgi:hypothetical protein
VWAHGKIPHGVVDSEEVFHIMIEIQDHHGIPDLQANHQDYHLMEAVEAVQDPTQTTVHHSSIKTVKSTDSLEIQCPM